MNKTPMRLLAAAVPFALLPALAGAHTLGGAPHSHDATAWGGLVAATALCWALLRGARRLSARRDAARLDGRRAGCR